MTDIDTIRECLLLDGQEIRQGLALAALERVERLRAGLEAAAQSLTTISAAGVHGDTGLEDLADVRGYATSRALAAM